MRISQILKPRLTETLGKVYSNDGEQGVGYWYNPRSNQHHTIVWGAAQGEGLHDDHAYVVMDHPEWFGLTADDVDDTDNARYGATLNGWVRIGFNPEIGLWMDAASPTSAIRALRWFTSHHSEKIDAITLDILTTSGETSYRMLGDDVAAYEANGKLEPAWKTGTRVVQEAPIAIHHIDSDSEVSSFRDDDHTITRAPKPVEKIKKIWKTSVADVELYLYDRGLDKDETLNTLRLAKRTAIPKHKLSQAQRNDELYLDDMEKMVASIVPNPEAITVVLTNNEGSGRMPLTGWMIAHRLCHAMEISKNTDFGAQPQGLREFMKKSFRDMANDLEEIYAKTNIYPKQLSCLIGTTKACRDRTLTQPGELYPECFAQYMLTGKVKLNPLPSTVVIDGRSIKLNPHTNSYIADDIKYRQTKMMAQFAQIIEMAKGHVFTL